MSNKDVVIHIFSENWTALYRDLLGQEVLAVVGPVNKIRPQDLEKVLGKFRYFARISYGGAGTRQMVMAMGSKLAAVIASRVWGEETAKEEITAAERSSVEEVLNRMFSACSGPLREALGREMQFSGVKLVELHEAAAVVGSESAEVWNCVLRFPGAGKEKFVLVTPAGFAGVEKEIPGQKIPREVGIGPAGAPHRTAGAPANGAAYFSKGANIDLLLDIELPVTVRIGAVQMRLIDIMKLGPGSVIELEKSAEDPVEVLVDDRLVARGEVVVCDGHFAVRIGEVQSKAGRIKSLS